MTGNPLRLLWGAYAWLLVVTLPVLVMPRLSQRRAAAGLACRV